MEDMESFGKPTMIMSSVLCADFFLVMLVVLLPERSQIKKRNRNHKRPP